MKVAPIIHEIIRQKTTGVDIDYSLVHTGQHYDKKMSGDFFEQLHIPEPDANLNAGGGTQAEQTGAIMVRFEEHLTNNPTDLVLVGGCHLYHGVRHHRTEDACQSCARRSWHSFQRLDNA